MKVGNENIIGLEGSKSLGTQLELLIHLGAAPQILQAQTKKLRTPIILLSKALLIFTAPLWFLLSQVTNTSFPMFFFA